MEYYPAVEKEIPTVCDKVSGLDGIMLSETGFKKAQILYSHPYGI